MGFLTTHVLDTANGKPADGLRLELFKILKDVKNLVTERSTNIDGRCDQPIAADNEFTIGTYQIEFHVGEYFKKKGIILPVSAPFHCSLMKKAAENMKTEIENTNLMKPKPNIISNVTAQEENDLNKIKPLLIDQITSRVRWRESINYMIKHDVKDFLEIGPGKVLSSLVKKINSNVKVMNINSIEDINND